jgi:glycosyltransferase involved in cell wall biosynthesis
MLLDCIIPVCDQCEYTEGILADISAQEELPDTIHLIDNGSSDNTPDIVKSYIWDKKLPINYIRNEKNIGVNASWNLGIWTSTADILSILNNDLRIPTDFFKTIRTLFEQNPDYGYIIPRTMPKIEEISGGNGQAHKTDPAPIREGWAFSILRKICINGGPIPETVFTFFGDDFLFDQSRVQGYKNIKVRSLMIFHFLSRSLYSSGGAETWGADIQGWNIKRSHIEPVAEWSKLMTKYKTPWNELPMHIDMSPYASFYWDVIDALLNRAGAKRVTIVELGTRFGCSARIMLDRLPEKGNWQMFLVDPKGNALIDEITDNVKTIFNEETAQGYVGTLMKDSVDLLHIDVDPHTYEYTKEIFDLYVSKIKKGGVVIFHDCTDFFGVKKFVDELDRSKWEVTYCDQHEKSPISAPAAAKRIA